MNDLKVGEHDVVSTLRPDSIGLAAHSGAAAAEPASFS